MKTYKTLKTFHLSAYKKVLIFYGRKQFLKECEFDREMHCCENYDQSKQKD